MKTTLTNITLIIGLSLFSVASIAKKNNEIEVKGNFLKEAQVLNLNKSQQYQPKFVDPLSGYMRTVFPKEIDTVRGAVQYVLEPTGYKLVSEYPAPMSANILLNQRLPLSIKVVRTMPIIDVLQLLVGTDNTIIIDPAHRLISFEKGKRK